MVATALERDIAWKAAAGLALSDKAFHPTVLTLWRNKLRAFTSERPQRIFDAVRAAVAGNRNSSRYVAVITIIPRRSPQVSNYDSTYISSSLSNTGQNDMLMFGHGRVGRTPNRDQ